MTFSGVQGLAQSWQLSILHSFGNPEFSSQSPVSGVILGSDGKIYGTASEGGAGGGGTIFRINKSGNHFEVLHSFTNRLDDSLGNECYAGLLEASDGKLYGTTLGGGVYSGGTVYRINRDGSGFEVLHHFERFGQQDAIKPFGELIEADDGMLYGTTRAGGAIRNGSVFRLNRDGSDYEVVHEFNPFTGEGSQPECPLFQASDGSFYGTLTDGSQSEKNENLGKGKIFKMNSDGTEFQIIHDFSTHSKDGLRPVGGLVEGRDGFLYSTCRKGGPNKGGIIFKLRKDGTDYRILHSFTSRITDPREPFGPLLKARNGLLYGIVCYAGPQGFGGIYCLSENGLFFHIVKQFKKRSDGIVSPLGALAQDSVGNLYGASVGEALEGGTLFECTLNGKFRKLHTFSKSGRDGALPNAQLSATTNGVLYGGTVAGGEFGHGTLFRINADGTGYEVLRHLTAEPSGIASDPTSSRLYFTMHFYSPGGGALFSYTIDKKTKILHRFFNGDAIRLNIPLLGNDGKLYGIAGNGSAYQINQNGRGYRILHRFDRWETANSALMQGADGALFGTTIFRDAETAHFGGTVFKMNSDGTGFTNMFRLDPTKTENMLLNTRLLQGSDRSLYGTAQRSSSSIAYRIGLASNGFEVLHTFPNQTVSPVIEGADGALYGRIGGSSGAIFRLERNGSGFSIIQNVPSDLNVGLTPLPDGSLCEVAMRGGTMGFGFAFKLTPPSSRPSINVR